MPPLSARRGRAGLPAARLGAAREPGDNLRREGDDIAAVGPRYFFLGRRVRIGGSAHFNGLAEGTAARQRDMADQVSQAGGRIR